MHVEGVFWRILKFYFCFYFFFVLNQKSTGEQCEETFWEKNTTQDTIRTVTHTEYSKVWICSETIFSEKIFLTSLYNNEMPHFLPILLCNFFYLLLISTWHITHLFVISLPL